MEISRRAFLMSTAAALATVASPGLAIEAGYYGGQGPIGATGPARIGTAWAVGTSGEFNWHRVFAETREEAYRTWLGGDDDPDFEISDAVLDESTFRVERWDCIEELKPADWFRAGMGHICDRCSGEAYSDYGSMIIDEDRVICEECITFGDRCLIDQPDDLVEDLIEFFDNHDGPDGARAFLMARDWWDDLPVESWNAAMEWVAKNP